MFNSRNFSILKEINHQMQLYNPHLLCGVWGATGSTEEEQIGTATAATAHSRFHTKQLEQSEPCFNSAAARTLVLVWGSLLATAYK